MDPKSFCVYFNLAHKDFRLVSYHQYNFQYHFEDTPTTNLDYYFHILIKHQINAKGFDTDKPNWLVHIIVENNLDQIEEADINYIIVGNYFINFGIDLGNKCYRLEYSDHIGPFY